MEPKFQFKPLSKAWVAIHPNPIGVINFIGGAFFGSFPTLFYRNFLRQLFEQGYTLIAMPFRFTLRHWSVAIDLALDLVDIRSQVFVEAQRVGYASSIYAEDPCASTRNYFWIGHSLGNKYIALLELLSDLEFREPREVLAHCVPANQVHTIERRLQNQNIDFHQISLFNQPSVLIAPAITGIEGAIPFKPLADFVKRFIDVQPTVEETYCLIQKSRLFKVMGLIAFQNDKIAEATVHFLRGLPNRPRIFKCLPGGHLTPIGVHSGDHTLANTILKFFEELTEAITTERDNQSNPEGNNVPTALTPAP